MDAKYHAETNNFLYKNQKILKLNICVKNLLFFKKFSRFDLNENYST